MIKSKNELVKPKKLPRGFVPYPSYSRYGLRIGIDPDCAKNGVAIKGVDLELKLLNFFGLFDLFESTFQDEVRPIIIIEAGWLNKKSNWHKATSKGVSDMIAKKVGANHETGRKIVEMVQYFGFDYTLIQPTTAKITPEVFYKLTKIKTRNQEMIDAAMLIL